MPTTYPVFSQIFVVNFFIGNYFNKIIIDRNDNITAYFFKNKQQKQFKAL